VAPPEATHHLRYLVATGLVQSRKDGPWMRYRIADHTGPEQQLVLDTARTLLANVLVADAEERYGRWMRTKTPGELVTPERAAPPHSA
jgi:DNA-binding transcriptional ArsR family regulator